MVLLYTVFLLAFITSVERENTMCGGVKVLKNKYMPIFMMSKENSLSNCGGLNGCSSECDTQGIQNVNARLAIVFCMRLV